jgi:CheY-like chemotaxis protein
MSEKKKIVLAEDNSVLSLLLKFRLEKDGYHLFMAKDGKEAIDFIENENPDLILTDVMMDYFSGLEVLVTLEINLKVKCQF